MPLAGTESSKQSQVAEQLNVVERLWATKERLSERLLSVMENKPPKEEVAKTAPPMELVPLAFELRDQVLKLQDLENSINQLIQSIEL